MTRRILSKSSGAPAGKFSSDDLDYVNQLLTGTDQGASDPVLMNTLLRVYGSKLRFRSSGSGNPDYTVVNPSGTTARNLTIPNLGQDDTVAVLTEPQTLAGKTLTSPTLTSPIISSISNTGTLTLPTSTDTLVGRATTDTLTNKTIDVNSANTLIGVLVSPAVKHIAWWDGAMASNTGVGFWTGTSKMTNTTTITGVNNATGKYTNWQSMAATIDADAGMRVSDADGSVCRVKNCRFKARFRCTPTGLTGSYRFFCGLSNITTLLTGDDPLNAKDGVLLCLRAADTNFQIAHNDNAGATVFDIDTGVARDSAIHTIEIKASGDSQFQWSLDGSAFSSTNLTADIPRTTAGLFACVQIETTAAEIKQLDGFYMYVDQDI